MTIAFQTHLKLLPVINEVIDITNLFLLMELSWLKEINVIALFINLGII